MAVELFNLATLSSIDQGRIAAAFEHELKRCEADCKDRPGLEDTRKITLVVTMTPILGDSPEDLGSCSVQFHVESSIPKRKSKLYNMELTASGLLFNELSPEDVRQRTLDMAPKPKAVANVG